MTEPALPTFQTDTEDVYLDAGAQFAGWPVKPRIAKSNYGLEMLAYDLVNAGFLDRRMTPRNREYYESRGAGPVILEFTREGNLPFMAPDKHDRIRAILGKAFTRSRIETLRPRMRETVRMQIAAFIDRCECDIVDDLCHLYAVRLRPILTRRSSTR